MPRDALQAPLVLNEPVKPADVIIVLGSGTSKKGDHMTTQGRQRVAAGVLAINRGLAPRVIMAGGLNRKTNFIEADVMAEYAVSRGMSDADIVPEVQSRDTWENAKNSLVIMRDNGWKSAIVITSPYHTWRACRMFRKQGASVKCMVAPYALVPADSFFNHLMDTRSVIREYGAIVYNWLKDQL